MPLLDEWHSKDIMKKFNNMSWNNSIKELHKPENIGNFKEHYYQRLAYDEIFSTFLVNSEIRKLKRLKKKKKTLDQKNKIL